MLKHLRRRLTILFSILTAAVLAAALTATCRMAQIEAVSGADLVFANTVSAIEDAVTENNLVRDSWLASQEAAGRLVLYMEDNGHPLVFSGGLTPADARTTLVALAREQAVSAGLNPDRLHRQKVNFSLNGAQLSGSYTCTAMLLPSEQMSSAVLLYIIRDMGPLHDRLWAMVWQYTALWAAGALLSPQQFRQQARWEAWANESLAHLAWLRYAGRLVRCLDEDGVYRFAVALFVKVVVR